MKYINLCSQNTVVSFLAYGPSGNVKGKRWSLALSPYESILLKHTSLTAFLLTPPAWFSVTALSRACCLCNPVLGGTGVSNILTYFEFRKEHM